MAKKKRIAHDTPELSEGIDFLKPVNLEKIGTVDDPCFGKLHDLAEDACQSCGDSELCQIVMAQKRNVERNLLEKETVFKDIEPHKKEVVKHYKKILKETGKKSEALLKTKKKFKISKETIKQWI